MRPTDQPTHEATEIRPWRVGDPEPHIRTYPHGREPLLWIYTHGRWRYAVVQARHTYSDLLAVQTQIQISDRTRGNYSRTYRWDPACTRIIRAARDWHDTQPGDAGYGPRPRSKAR
jgi:hypothetical protein